MTIRYKCGECGVTLKIKDNLAGTDGKCPQCKAAFKVPTASPLDSDAEIPSAGASTPDSSENDEDDIFGKDFFSLQTPNSSRPKYTVPAFEDDHEIPGDDEPANQNASGNRSEESGSGGPKKKAAKAGPPSENSADIAGTLLSKTGKKNRPEDAAPPQDEGGYDYTELKWLLKTRVAPIVGGTVVVVYLLYSLMMSVMTGGPELPPLGEVRGTVMLDGQPAPAGIQLMFIPLASEGMASGSASTGITGEKGAYEANYNPDVKGAMVGQHQVRIMVGGRRHERTIDVKPGDNEQNFELTSM